MARDASMCEFHIALIDFLNRWNRLNDAQVTSVSFSGFDSSRRDYSSGVVVPPDLSERPAPADVHEDFDMPTAAEVQAGRKANRRILQRYMREGRLDEAPAYLFMSVGMERGSDGR